MPGIGWIAVRGLPAGWGVFFFAVPAVLSGMSAGAGLRRGG
jgi:hypothetical protein